MIITKAGEFVKNAINNQSYKRGEIRGKRYENYIWINQVILYKRNTT